MKKTATAPGPFEVVSISNDELTTRVVLQSVHEDIDVPKSKLDFWFPAHADVSTKLKKNQIVDLPQLISLVNTAGPIAAPAIPEPEVMTSASSKP